MRVYLTFLFTLFLAFSHGLVGQSETDRNLQYQQFLNDLDTLIQKDPKYALTRFDSLESYYEYFTGPTKAYFYAQREWNHFRLGNYRQALDDLRLAKSFSEANENYYLDGIYLQLGHLYEAIDSMDLAIYNYKQSIKWIKELGLEADLSNVYIGLAQVYEELEQLDSSQFYYESNLDLVTRLNDSINIPNAKANYATFLFGIGQENRAIKLQLEVLEFEQANRDSIAMIFSNANLGRYYYVRDHELSSKYIETAFTIALKIGAKSHLLELYEGFALIEAEYGNYQMALEYYKSFHDLQNELLNIDMIDRVKEWQIMSDNQKKDEEIKLQKALMRNLFIIFSIVLVLSFWIIHSNVQIRKVKNQLETQNIELDELNATKDKFFSIIAHDLRSPMIGLQGVGQKLDYFIKKNKQEKLLELGGQIDQSIDQLNHLLNNLLNWASSETQGIPYHPKKLELKALLKENIDLYRSLAETKEIEIIDESTEQVVHADGNTVSTIIRNLLSNAIKFTPKGGKVIIRDYQNARQLGLTIKDEGPGMDTEQLAALGSGELASATGSNNEKGFGLGLKLCREFVELNFGVMVIQSEKGSGSVFSFALPKEAKGIIRDISAA